MDTAIPLSLKRLILGNKNALMAVILIALAGLMAKNIYSGYKIKVEKLDKEKKDLEEKILLVKDIGTLEDIIKKLKVLLLDKDPIDFQGFINKVAADTDVEIVFLKPEINEKLSIYREAKIILSLKGAYRNIIDFIMELVETKGVEVNDLRVASGEVFSLTITGMLKP